MKSIKKRGGALVALALGAALCLGLAGCGGSSSSNEPKELNAGSTAYFYAEGADPANSWDGWELQYYGVTENLLKLTDDFNVEPWLAASCENVDATTWKMTLRDDVTFSNGEKMTAESVKACLERTYEQNSRAAETLALDSIEADGQELVFHTKQAVPSFQNIMCDPIFSIYYTADGMDYAAETPCTGPYVIDELIYEDHCTLVPNENYWDGTPALSKITLKTFFDDDSQTVAMQNNEVDVLAMPGMSSYNVLTGSDYQVLAQNSTRSDFIRFNMKHKVVANDAVRLAVSYCIEREGYAKTICLGTEEANYGVYGSQLPYGGTDGLDVTVTGCDVEAAKAALDAAGVVDNDGDGIRELKDGTPCVINLYNCSAYERFMQLADDMQNKLAEAGIKLKIHTVDYWLQDFDTYNHDDPDMTIDSYGVAPTGDADYFASMCFKSDGSNNFGSYKNADVDALIQKLEATFDADERTAIIKQISQKVLDDNAYIFFSTSTTSYIVNKKVKNIAVAPSEYYFITKDTTVD